MPVKKLIFDTSFELEIQGEATFKDDVVLEKTLTITDNLILSSNIEQTNSSQSHILQGELTLQSASKTTTILGSVNIQEQLSVTGNTTLGQTDSNTTNILGTVTLGSAGKTMTIYGNISQSQTDVTIRDLTQRNITSSGLFKLTDSTQTHILEGDLTLSNIGKTTNVRGDLSVDEDLLVSGDQAFGDTVVNGDLTLFGDTLYVNPSQGSLFNISQQEIRLNSEETGEGVQINSGIQGLRIVRGTFADQTIYWDEVIDKFKIQYETGERIRAEQADPIDQYDIVNLKTLSEYSLWVDGRDLLMMSSMDAML